MLIPLRAEQARRRFPSGGLFRIGNSAGIEEDRVILLFDDDVYTSNEDGARHLANQARKARTTVQVASLDGSNTAWTRLNAPGLLLVSRGNTIRVSGKELDDLIAACLADGEFIVGHPSSGD